MLKSALFMLVTRKTNLTRNGGLPHVYLLLTKIYGFYILLIRNRVSE